MRVDQRLEAVTPNSSGPARRELYAQAVPEEERKAADMMGERFMRSAG